jgi:F0F1-type ATP synthase assembly protein I
VLQIGASIGMGPGNMEHQARLGGPQTRLVQAFASGFSAVDGGGGCCYVPGPAGLLKGFSLGENGETKRPETPSPDEYEKLRIGADALRQASMSDQSEKAVRRRKLQGGMHAYVRYTGIGLQFVLTIGLGLLAGYGLDHLLGTDPWLMMVGALVGSVGAMVWVVKTVLRMEARSGAKSAAKGPSNKDQT